MQIVQRYIWVIAASYNHSHPQDDSTNLHNDITGQWIILLTREGKSCRAAELLNETTVLNISEGEKAGTAERGLGMKETKEGRWNKQTWGRRERDENIFFCALLAVLHSGPIISWAVLGSLMFNYWKHSSSPSPAKQYPANISSRHHLTDGNIKISWGLLEKKVGGRGEWARVPLIVTIMKPLVKTATCQETTIAQEHKINTASSLIVPGKMYCFHL